MKPSDQLTLFSIALGAIAALVLYMWLVPY
jgi:hypothetical protein